MRHHLLHTLSRFWWIILLLALPATCLLFRPPGFEDPLSTVIEDRDGRLLGAMIADDGQWRFPPPDSLPEKMVKSIILFEDKNFRQHPGIDGLALIRALALNVGHGRIVSGGSTISMQVIRLMRKGKPRTIQEKIVEIFLALRLEMIYSKEDILRMYLSHAPFGGNVVGLEAATWRYFSCTPADMTWADAACLAVLPNAPGLIHPGRNRDTLLEKRNALLNRLFDHGDMDTLDWKLARQEQLPANPKPLPQLAPHLLARMHSEHKGERVQTTIDHNLQMQLQSVLDRHVKNLKNNEIHNASALILEVESGDVLAYAGNTTVGEGQHGEMVDVIMAHRSSGSVLKPLLYAAMLEDGAILPGTLIPDIPTRMAGFSPKNYNDTYDGAVHADMALSRSLNIPAINMLRDYGVGRFHAFLQDLGMTSLDRPAGTYGLSLILGGAEITLWDLAGIYAGMSRVLNNFYARSGRYSPGDIHPPVVTRHGRQEDNALTDERLLGASSIWLTYKAMQEVNRPEREENWEAFTSSRRVAWKTGTSFGFRDAWAVGTDPGYVVAVWAGNADGEGRPGLTGLTAAAPLMFDLFDLLPRRGWFDQPFDEMRKIAVCSHSGYRMGADCEMADSLWVPLNGLRSLPCPYHRIVHLDSSRQYRVTEECESVDDMIHQKWFVLPPAMEWYYKKGHSRYATLPPYRPDCLPQEQAASMAFLYPDNDARIFIPVELDGEPGEMVLELAHRKPETTVYWHLDEEYIGTTIHRHQMGIRTMKGEHLVTAVDEQGRMAVVRFTIVNQ